ncbi:MAG: deoxyribose-phosphate aldolase [Theionarchaea archaeon]|nr:MAG: 2-deoxyribose-5-phosphate aldolase [Theionarchaea archaeon DG-70-1]MBU7030306.1 deoxyribose-phosphate aldolase [Theionarchaea archaeon]
MLSKKEVASSIDHTNLSPSATSEDIKRLCQEAVQNKFKAVCVNSCYTRLASTFLKDTSVLTCTVVGFPLGAMAREAKAYEAEFAVKNGAQEIDMVQNIGALKENRYHDLQKDIEAVVSQGVPTKVILETCLLTEEEIVTACKIAQQAGAHFVKTSTGYSVRGATIEDVQLMKKTVPDLKVKAAGGIKTFEQAVAIIEAGADRIGASRSLEIIK